MPHKPGEVEGLVGMVSYFIASHDERNDTDVIWGYKMDSWVYHCRGMGPTYATLKIQEKKFIIASVGRAHGPTFPIPSQNPRD